jgi:hypothetical protein
MVLVAVCMVAIIAMAALSIDVVTLYLARQEAQRAADAAALAAARVISISGITGVDPADSTSWEAICGGSTSVASLAATSAARVNAVAGITPTVSVLYSVQGASGGNTDCYNLHSNTALPINPTVTVQVTRSGMPTLFSRIWSPAASSVSATAVAEVFNSSNSGSIAPGGDVIPVWPRCVKPWVVPNLDPRNPDGCTTNCTKFVDRGTGQIQNPGVSLGGVGNTGTIGENFWLEPNCQYTNPSSCNPMRASPTQANLAKSGIAQRRDPPNLLYLPGQVGTPVSAIPACSEGDSYEQAIEGCDAPTNYQCGAPAANKVDLSRNPDYGSTSNGVSCLIHQANLNDVSNSSGQDYLSPFGAPSAYPFQILAGSSNPAGAGLSGNPISSSTSIVSLPIYDNTGVSIPPGGTTTVTFIGFLQVFINAVDQYGNINVTVLNVSGCGNSASTSLSAPGSSPVPIRLVTPQ